MRCVRLSLSRLLLVGGLCFCLLPASGRAQSLLVYQRGCLGGDQSGYGCSQWTGFSGQLDGAFASVNVVNSLIGQPVDFDALLVMTQSVADPEPDPAGTAAYITAVLATGRRVVLFGENPIWHTWNHYILGIVGSDTTGTNVSGFLRSIHNDTVNALVAGVDSIFVDAGGAARTGGHPLFTSNVATLWLPEDNALTVLDTWVMNDGSSAVADNAAFAGNVATWLSESESPPNGETIPEPATLLLLGSGLLGLAAGLRRRRHRHG